MTQHSQITLFTMPGCHVCPTMERVFRDLQEQELVKDLSILDVTEHPELARQHDIRSVPFYLINNVAFHGLKSRRQIEGLLKQGEQHNWADKIRQDLSEGQLESIEQGIRNHEPARQAMLDLLHNEDTELVVRVGLTAVIETLAETGLFARYEHQFIDMSEHVDERIATDALYYLHLIATAGSLRALQHIASHGSPMLRVEAEELLAENLSAQVSI